MLRRIVFAILLLAFPSLAFAGPKEDAQAAFDKFFPAFTAARVDDVVGLFASDALFYGTSSREVVTTPAGVRAYFTNAFGTPPRAPGIDTASQLGTATVLMLSDNAAVISGMWKIDSIAGGQTATRGPFRVTAAVSKRGERWQIVQFHNSPQPAAPAPAAPVAPPVR